MSARFEVLVVDDYPGDRKLICEVLADEGHTCSEAGDGEAALQVLGDRRFDVAVLDVNMPGMNGLVAMMRMQEMDPELSMVIVTGEEAIKTAREAVLKLGAFDVVGKVPDPEHLIEVIEEAGRMTRSRRQREPIEPELGIVGDTPAIKDLVESIRRTAPSQGRVLITGENGAGKELVARAIHQLSRRSSGPFVKLNCAAIPKDLVESELFGYERGAFTGAMQSKKGRLELADKGTLFLDEIGDLSLEAQAKLLRAVETGEVERVGGTRTQQVDVRIVAATNKDLAAAIEAGDFRQDLYYRLNVLPLHVPPLRERRADISSLAHHMLAAFCAAEGKPMKRLQPEAVALLEDYHWPGNVRELRNLMERAAILIQAEEVRAADISTWLEGSAGREDSVGLRGEIERREADAIRKALESAHWNVTQAAAGLGIDRTNLHRKMRKYGIARR